MNQFDGVPRAKLEHEAFTRLKNEVTTRPRGDNSWVHFRTIIRHLIAAASTTPTGEGTGWIPESEGLKDGRTFYHAAVNGKPIRSPLAWLYSPNAGKDAWCPHPNDSMGIILPHDPQPTHLNPGICPPPGHQAWRDREAAREEREMDARDEARQSKAEYEASRDE